MVGLNNNPLDEMDETALFKMLGDAWIAQSNPVQLKPESSRSTLSSVTIGKREFDTIVPILRETFNRPYRHGDAAGVANTLKGNSIWRMPAIIVVALARHHGMLDAAS